MTHINLEITIWKRPCQLADIQYACVTLNGAPLYKWWLYSKKLLLGWASVIRIYRDKAVPATPEIAPNIKYKVPMSLWFVEKSQRVTNL